MIIVRTLEERKKELLDLVSQQFFSLNTGIQLTVFIVAATKNPRGLIRKMNG